MRKNKVGIFGGSFNPIHLGHTALAAAICDRGLVDEVWFMVSPQNPFKVDEELLDEQRRLAMVRLAVAGDERLRASDFEFTLPRPSYTSVTLRALTDAYPDTEFSLIIGEDNWDAFDRWHEADYILKHHPIIVYPRADEDDGGRKTKNKKQEAVAAQPRLVANEVSDSSFVFSSGTAAISSEQSEPLFLTDAPLLPVSSTLVRERLRQGLPVDNLVAPAVSHYLHANELYLIDKL